ncbi:AAA family ATPase [Limosilactobacillus sp.]|uniref:AAA family ATPase n=1 Tax=Limosilactobacillus sp. TaxID=2773925 RepID=UPI0035A07885
MQNPFNPSFGIQPTVLLNRSEILQKLVASIKDLNTPYRTTLIYGTRGVGKTVFMNEVGKQISQDDNWLVLHLIIGNNMIGRLVDLLYQKAATPLQKLLDQISGVQFSIGGISFDHSSSRVQSTTNYQILLEKMLKILKEHQQNVLVMIDEAQDVPGMVELASVYQVLISEGLPISIIMTGLPKNVQELQNNHVLTFLLRSGRVNLSPLNFFDIRAQYQYELTKRDPNIKPEVVRRVAQLVDGYAYAFQLMGYLLWQSPGKRITNQTVDQILPQYQAQLSRNAYSKMMEELSPVDQQFVIAAARADQYPVSVAYLGKKLKRNPGYIGVYRRRLIDSQIIAPAGYGHLKFALPLFKKFVIEDGQYLIEN